MLSSFSNHREDLRCVYKALFCVRYRLDIWCMFETAFMLMGTSEIQQGLHATSYNSAKQTPGSFADMYETELQ